MLPHPLLVQTFCSTRRCAAAHRVDRGQRKFVQAWLRECIIAAGAARSRFTLSSALKSIDTRSGSETNKGFMLI